MTTRVLLIEDDPDYARYIELLLQEHHQDPFAVFNAQSLREGVALLGDRDFDAVLLDLMLPDSSGLDSLRVLQELSRDIPTVVLTGMNDEQLALDCISCGAQDYLDKDEIDPLALRRVIAYALARSRERQLTELKKVLGSYDKLSSTSSTTGATQKLVGLAPLKQRDETAFRELAGEYLHLLELYLEHIVVDKSKPRAEMESVITRLGDLGGGPRDLIDVHTQALHRCERRLNRQRAHYYALEGRLFALEMMGLLVDYYRINTRRGLQTSG